MSMTAAIESTRTAMLPLLCPACRGRVDAEGEAHMCASCGRIFPASAGHPDLRLVPDRYLSLAAERRKAERLAALAPETDLAGLAAAYYDMTDDVVDRRRDRFLRHIAGALARGEALASRLPASGSILELGCGTGGLLAALAASGRRVVGVDIASRWLVVARRRLDDQGLCVPLVAAGAEALPWADATFDVVVADSLLEHLDDPSAALREARRVLRPGGRLVLWSPNRGSLATDPHLGLWGLGWIPRPLLPAYLRARGRSEWPPRTLAAGRAARLARRAGFRDVRVSPPTLTPSWIASRPVAEQPALRVYERLRQWPVLRAGLRLFGPLWELTAFAGSDA